MPIQTTIVLIHYYQFTFTIDFLDHEKNASRSEDALRILCEQAAEREYMLAQLSPTQHKEPEHEFEAESLILCSFYPTGWN